MVSSHKWGRRAVLAAIGSSAIGGIGAAQQEQLTEQEVREAINIRFSGCERVTVTADGLTTNQLNEINLVGHALIAFLDSTGRALSGLKYYIELPYHANVVDLVSYYGLPGVTYSYTIYPNDDRSPPIVEVENPRFDRCWQQLLDRNQ